MKEKGDSDRILNLDNHSSEESVVLVFSGKTDVQSAFHSAPLRRSCFKWLLMKAQDLTTGIWKYFIDKCLPFGASISCAIFQRFSDALKFLIKYWTGVP